MQPGIVGELHPEVIKSFHQKGFCIPLIGVTGGKGGVGKTTVAVNMAIALVDMGFRVALVDADVDAPNAAILLGLPLENPVDVATTIPLINQEKCTSCGKCVEVCRLNALFLPPGKAPTLIGDCNGCEACLLVCEAGALAQGNKIVGKIFRTTDGNLTLYTGALLPRQAESAVIVKALKKQVQKEAHGFDIMIVDTAPGIHCDVISALQGADFIVAVTEPTPLGAHDLDLILSLLGIFKLTGTVLVNRADLPGVKDKIDFVVRQYQITVSAEINLDEALLKSCVEGVPVVRGFPEAPSAKKIIELAQFIKSGYLA